MVLGVFLVIAPVGMAGFDLEARPQSRPAAPRAVFWLKTSFPNVHGQAPLLEKRREDRFTRERHVANLPFRHRRLFATVDSRTGEGAPTRHHLAQLAGKQPAHAHVVSKKRIHRIQGPAATRSAGGLVAAKNMQRAGRRSKSKFLRIQRFRHHQTLIFPTSAQINADGEFRHVHRRTFMLDRNHRAGGLLQVIRQFRCRHRGGAPANVLRAGPAPGLVAVRLRARR